MLFSNRGELFGILLVTNAHPTQIIHILLDKTFLRLYNVSKRYIKLIQGVSSIETSKNQRDDTVDLFSVISDNDLVFFALSHYSGNVGTYYERKFFCFFCDVCSIIVPGKSLLRLSLSCGRSPGMCFKM